MSDLDKALQTQVNNIEAKTGKSLAELTEFILQSELKKHGELRDLVKAEFGLGHGDANTLVHLAKKAAEEAGSGPKTTSDLVSGIYSGKHAALRPLHDAVMAKVETLGDFELAPKKNYVSLRRKKQFATLGPGSRGRVEVGLNMQDVPATERLEELPAGRMCQYRVYLSDASEVDKELMGWVRTAYENAG